MAFHGGDEAAFDLVGSQRPGGDEMSERII
jgi:hypothetical protein